MKDLKHLIYFERLLENADNELVEKAKADGGVLKQTFEVDQMLKIFQMLHLFFKEFLFFGALPALP